MIFIFEWCSLHSPKQKIVKFHAQKLIGKSHVIDIFTSEDMENISLCIFQYLTLSLFTRKLSYKVSNRSTHKKLSNFHFDLSFHLFQGEVCMTFQGRFKTISGEVRSSPQNPAMLNMVKLSNRTYRDRLLFPAGHITVATYKQ